MPQRKEYGLCFSYSACDMLVNLSLVDMLSNFNNLTERSDLRLM